MAVDESESSNGAAVAEKHEKTGDLDHELGQEHEIQVEEQGKLARNLKGRHMQVRVLLVLLCV
jgi:hypothetical protein